MSAMLVVVLFLDLVQTIFLVTIRSQNWTETTHQELLCKRSASG